MHASGLLEAELSRMQLEELEREVTRKGPVGSFRPSTQGLPGPMTLLGALAHAGARAFARRFAHTS